METSELTTAEIGILVGTTPGAAHKRLMRHGYKPSRYIGVNAMFKLSSDDIEYLKQCNKRGHPKASDKSTLKKIEKPTQKAKRK